MTDDDLSRPRPGDVPAASRPVTTVDKVRCLQRELALRRNVYPKRVEAGKMKPHHAALELRVMEAILADYL